MSKYLIAFLLIFVADSATAQQPPENSGWSVKCAISTIGGALLGSLVGAGSGQTLAIGVGAVAGSELCRNANTNKNVPGYQIVDGYASGESPVPPDCDYQYYEGVYDPAAARVYCNEIRRQWNRDRQVYLREVRARAKAEYQNMRTD